MGFRVRGIWLFSFLFCLRGEVGEKVEGLNAGISVGRRVEERGS
jgi:hypothetical protein